MDSQAIPLLEVQNLTVEFATRRGTVRAVKRVDLSIARGETLGVVGESGSGKSVTSYAVMRILDRAGRIAEGSIAFSGVALRDLSESEMQDIRGREISMIFQNPRAALNPIRPVGRQIADVLRRHGQATRTNARAKAIEALEQVRIARAAERYDAYPFELSGGMCQRVVIALALACRPRLLIADEPTTGLDVTTQKAVMDLVAELTRERGLSTLLITHDLGLAAAYCDRVAVMQQGEVVEQAAAEGIFRAPQHPYTRRLMRATPRPGAQLRDLLPEGSAAPLPDAPAAKAAPDAPPLLEVTGLVKEYPREGKAGLLARWLRRGEAPAPFRAVDGIGFTLRRGESVGLVGESGCGKSTTSMMLMRLLDPSAGSIRFLGQEIGAMPARGFAASPLRRRIQMVFQDPTDSLNPRLTAARAIADPILRMGDARGGALRERVAELADLVGLPRALLHRFPHQLSGGQKARVGIARAIALNPDLVILDEPTAALDVSVQAVVLNLLQDLKLRLGMSYLFVSHDLHVVRLLCDRVIVMRQGRIVEQGPTEQVLHAPQAEYTRELLAAIPHPPG
ncbi:dipeptide ABC transporter ATP-binding protein [Teichococcus cervicalis]|uniref:Putative phosphonate C-P lyase system protein PhnK n=1 Tax=Pseudoroseomonas cervicalis ATCC 49957 TaxID=525371 RepID=D5RN68_9PROT|nr:ABC transporter ATP-binding protein [Pseudoroseomonas cervicalis]EFH11250.1 putative phosphonate C-P lyase system protein PhnK [Pseudoroseomonas cervicalis ATCC 49957]